MPTWTKSTGSSGTMKIEDNGSVVSFWLKAGSSTFNHETPWAYVVNGVSSSWREFDFESGGSYQMLGSWTVSSSQTVSFKLGDTGTSGLGGPTTLSAAIDRATVPPAPTTPVLTSVDTDSMVANSGSNGSGGATVDIWQMGYGTSSTTPTAFKNADLSNGVATLTGMTPGHTYYVWSRRHNSEGWSGWSGRASARTWAVPPAPSAPSGTGQVSQTSITVKFVSNGTGGGTGQPANTGYQLGYGTSPTAPTTIISSTGTSQVTGLTPGLTYYFWSRAINSVGTSAWSTRSQATLPPGAHITVGGVVKGAIPWVNVAGVWKIATPWAKIVGVWKETK